MRETDKPALTIRETAIAIFVVYAVLTLISSSLALVTGATTDTHVHLLLRFGVTTIGVGAFYVHGHLRRALSSAPSLLVAAVTYLLALAATLAGVWVYGRVDTLHPDAYRDITLNFTAVAIALSTVWSAASWWRLRRGPGRLLGPATPPGVR